MPTTSPPHPDTGMDMGSVSEEELSLAIRRSRTSSAPSLFDHISYLILKKCPSLHPTILNLFNCVMSEGKVPSSWRAAAVKLIAKITSLGNFRVIALTPVVSKLLSGIFYFERSLAEAHVNQQLP